VADEKKSSMTKEEALELLKGGEEGVAEFNRRRKKEGPTPLDLSGVSFLGDDLSGADLGTADLSGAVLAAADLTKADLVSANFSKADLYGADLRGASLMAANLRGASLMSADLTGCNLGGFDIGSATIRTADLREADLTDVRGLVLDGQSTRGARFSTRAADPWSVLRRQYTGPLMFINLALLVGFLAPYGARALGWWSVHLTQSKLGIGEAWEDTGTLWQLLLGWDRGPWYIVTALVLIVYNVLRAYLTRHLSLLRDEEERSGYAPTWKATGSLWHRFRSHTSNYGWAWKVHAYFLRWVFWFAIASFLFHAVPWLFTEIAVPPGVMD
jgi:hypothetical protein